MSGADLCSNGNDMYGKNYTILLVHYKQTNHKTNEYILKLTNHKTNEYTLKLTNHKTNEYIPKLSDRNEQMDEITNQLTHLPTNKPYKPTN